MKHGQAQSIDILGLIDYGYLMESAIAIPRPVEGKARPAVSSEQRKQPRIVETVQHAKDRSQAAVIGKLDDVRTKIKEVAVKKAGLERTMALSGIDQAAVLTAIERNGGRGTTGELIAYMQKHMGLPEGLSGAYKKARAVAAGFVDTSPGQNQSNKPLKLGLTDGLPTFVAKDNEALRKWLKQEEK